MSKHQSRRGFVRSAVTLAAGSLLPAGDKAWSRMLDPSRGASHPPGAPAAAPRSGEDSLEAALRRLARTGPEYAGGLANHGPMAAEALVALGRPEAVDSWVDRYHRRLGPHPEAGHGFDEAAWQESLGRFERVGDWAAYFDRQMGENDWAAVLDLWASRLAPGLVAAAMHGLIRAGHAARGLAARDTPARRHELAEGLAYWAARYQRLPEAAVSSGEPGPPSAPSAARPSQAISSVQLLPEQDRGPRRLIMEGVRWLDGFTPFRSVADMVDTSQDASGFLSDLTRTFAGVYLQQADHPGTVITFIHTVTGPSAIRLLLPHVAPRTRSALLRYGWQAAAGMYAALARPAPRTAVPPGGDEPPGGAADLIDRALATGDEHAIKFTEACLREHALNPERVYLAAARDAVGRLA